LLVPTVVSHRVGKRSLNRALGITVLLATHSREVASIANRIFFMRDGCIERIESSTLKEPDSIAAV